MLSWDRVVQRALSSLGMTWAETWRVGRDCLGKEVGVSGEGEQITQDWKLHGGVCAVSWEPEGHVTQWGGGVGEVKRIGSWRALCPTRRDSEFILWVMRRHLRGLRQKNDAKTPIAFDCLVYCLVVTNSFSPWETLFLPTLSLHHWAGLISFSGSRLSTAWTQAKRFVQGRASDPNQSNGSLPWDFLLKQLGEKHSLPSGVNKSIGFKPGNS